MNCKCHGSGCEKDIIDNYYCDSCFTELQKQKQKPKLNEAKEIHKHMFG
jgi:hypothetical protein